MPPDLLAGFDGCGRVERIEGEWLILTAQSYVPEFWDAIGAARMVCVAQERFDRPHSVLIQEIDHQRRALKFKGLAIVPGMTLWFPDPSFKEKISHV